MFQSRFPVLQAAAFLIHAPDHQPVLEQIVEHDEGAGGLGGQGGACRLAAENIQGTDKSHRHDRQTI